MELIKRYKVLAAILAVVVAVGVGCWVYQLIFGLTVTGMNNGTSWGLYITNFMFFVGLSAGGLIVASSASVFHITKFKAVALPAIILSTVCICAAGHVRAHRFGRHPARVAHPDRPQPTSPLLWDVCVITCYLIINVFYLVFMTRGNQHAVSIVSRFALPCAILVHSVTAWIFGLEAAKEGWYTAIMAPIFVASAMDSGLALLLVVLGVLKKADIYDTSRELMAMLAGLLCTCVAVDAFFIFCEVLTMAYPGAAGAETLALLTTGPTAPFFWFEIICGLVIPFCILVFAKNRQSAVLINVACVLIVVGVFCKRVWLLFTAFIVPNVMGAPGIISGSSEAAHATGTASFAVLSSYAPTLIEILVVAGVISLVILAFMVLASKLIVERREK